MPRILSFFAELQDQSPMMSRLSRRHRNQRTVVVSSTINDLTDYREAAKDAILRSSMVPRMMELDTASDTGPVTYSLQLVNEADVYVGIFAHRYGHIPSRNNPDRISVTEMEYNRALERDIPRLLFIISDDLPVGPAERDTGDQAAKLAALKARLKSDRRVGFFTAPNDLGKQIVQALSRLREDDLLQVKEVVQQIPGLPHPPEPYIAHPYILTQTFFGRHEELEVLDQWATSDDAMLVVEAIGGVGKSALTWEWFQHRVPGEFDGMLWWSFYESDSTVTNFVRHALAYATGQPLEVLNDMPQPEIERQLLQVLRSRRFLLVLDGLERILVAYHRMDAPQVSDEDVGKPHALSVGRDPLACADARHGDFLRKLVSCAKTKTLISTRFVPSDLTNRSDDPIPGVRLHHLEGLKTVDALALMRHLGVRGNDGAIQGFLEQLENHSLLLTVIAGRIKDYRPSPGDFDAWYGDEGHRLRLSELDLTQRRNDILKYALDGLKPELRKLLGQIAAFRYPLDYATISAFNPYRDPSDIPQSQAWLHLGLNELENRGLLRWDRTANRYDLHPVVRARAFEDLHDDERRAAFQRIRDHFGGLPPVPFEQVRDLADLRRELEIYYALVRDSLFEQAAEFYIGNLADALLHTLAAFHEILECLMPLFPEGYDQPPVPFSPELQGRIISEMAFALVLRLGEVSQALQLSVLRLKMELERRDTYGLAHALMDYAKFVSAENHIVMAIRATEIARDLARVTGDEENLAFSYLRSMENSITTGQWDAAEEAYRVYRDKHSTQGLPDYWLASAEQEHLQALFYQGLDIEIELDRVWDLTVRCRDAWNRRVVQWLQGEVALRKNDLDAAVNHFEQAMEMELNQGILWLGVSLRRIAVVRALQGHTGEARQMIEEVLQREIEDENKPYLDAAEVYLILGEREEASRCALQAYAQAWADGPPFIWWWELERAKQVLSALDIDPPQLPPFDPAKVGPIPLESEIRGLIAELDRKRAGDQGD